MIFNDANKSEGSNNIICFSTYCTANCEQIGVKDECACEKAKHSQVDFKVSENFEHL